MKKDNFVNIAFDRLVKRFEKADVIANMEKEYQQTKPSFISPKLIDDNEYLKKVKLNKDTICQSLISIKEKGLNSPLIVRRKKDHYEIVLGRKRLTAAKCFRLNEVPCVIIDVSEEELLVMLAADIRDSNYSNMVELSLVCNKLNEDYNFSQEDLAKLLHQSRSQISNIMRLKSFNENILKDISYGKLSFGHAKALITLPDDLIEEMVEKIYQNNLSVRQTEKMIYEYKNKVDFSNLQNKLENKFNCKVNINKNSAKFSFESETDKNKFFEKILKNN